MRHNTITATLFVLVLLCAAFMVGCSDNSTTPPVPPAVPAITGIAPDNGPVEGGTNVTITGANLADAISVTFDGTPASFVVNSPTQLTATTPAHAAGSAAVTVTTPGGTAGSPTDFTYNNPASPPTIFGLDIIAGPAAGGTNITITGTGFTGATAVYVGGTPVPMFTVMSDTEILTVTPAGAAGTTLVTVVTTAGTSNGVPFTYIPAPTIVTVVPNSGPTAGGSTVVITGTSFTSATAVSFGAAPATSFTVNSDTQITVVTPPAAAGSVSVTVSTSGGSVTLTNGYTYIPAP